MLNFKEMKLINIKKSIKGNKELFDDVDMRSINYLLRKKLHTNILMFLKYKDIDINTCIKTNIRYCKYSDTTTQTYKDNNYIYFNTYRFGKRLDSIFVKNREKNTQLTISFINYDYSINKKAGSLYFKTVYSDGKEIPTMYHKYYFKHLTN